MFKVLASAAPFFLQRIMYNDQNYLMMGIVT